MLLLEPHSFGDFGVPCLSSDRLSQSEGCIGWMGSNGGGTSEALKEPAIEMGELCLKGISRGCDRIARADATSSKPESNEPG